MAHLSLSTLGVFTVTLDGAPVAGFEYNKVRALLAYLAVESGRAHHREALAELLWPDRPTETSRSNLRKTLSTLRQAIDDEAASPPCLFVSRDTVQFNPASDHSLDTASFLSLLDACREHPHPRLDDCPPCIERLKQAAGLYQGDFLHQFYLNDSPAFDEWAQVRRDELRREVMKALAHLAAHHETRREYDDAIRRGRRQLEIEPTAEDAHRRLMQLYFTTGQRSAALAQYETCRRILADELGVEPAPETAALYQRLRADDRPAIANSPFAARSGHSPNPYAARAMIKDPAAFVGRAAEVRELFTRLAAMQSVSVVGPRRIGKSSLLYHLAHPSVYEHQLADPAPYVFAFVDLQELAGADAGEFFGAAAERMSRASGGRIEGAPAQEGASSGFRRFLSRAADAGLRLVLCCDEFEMICMGGDTPHPYDAGFFAHLRGLCSNYSLALVTSSQAGLYDLCHQGNIQTSQFWNIFTELPLGLMPESEARDLIRNPTFTDADTAFLLDLAGPHPFFLQIAAYHLFEARAGGPPDYGEIERRFFDEARRHYAYAWERLPGEGREALRALVGNPPISIEAALYQRLKREAIIAGTPDNAAPSSGGWRWYVREQGA